MSREIIRVEPLSSYLELPRRLPILRVSPPWAATRRPLRDDPSRQPSLGAMAFGGGGGHGGGGADMAAVALAAEVTPWAADLEVTGLRWAISLAAASR